MKFLFATIFFFGCSYIVIGQPKNARRNLLSSNSGDRVNISAGLTKTVLENNSTNISNFLRFYIPSAITSEGIEPAAVSNLNLDFGDDKVKLKLGFTRNKDEKKYLKNSFGLSASANAPEGIRTLFQYDKTPTDIQLGIAFTNVLKEVSYSYNGIASSEEAFWFNLNLNYTRNNVFVFSTDTIYKNLVNNNFSLLLSLNHYFNSWFNRKNILKRNIWNIGIGVGHFSNYDDLEDITLRKGSYVGSFFTEKESIIGKLGSLNREFGLIARASLFYPISHPESKAYILLGANFNAFGLGSDKFTANTNSGIYISKRKYDEDEQLLTDVFSFGILADYSALENWGTKDYTKKNFKVILVSQIPLRWK